MGDSLDLSGCCVLAFFDGSLPSLRRGCRPAIVHIEYESKRCSRRDESSVQWQRYALIQ